MPAVAYLSRNRQKALFHYSLTSFLLLCPLIAQAKLHVVATLPDLGSLAREIGKEKIDIVVLAKPNDDPHFVDPRPDFVASLHDADVLIDAGAGLEVGWLPPLLEKARNPQLGIGKSGRVQASQGIRLMNIPTTVTRASDAHPSGNPHFIVDPVVAKTIAQNFAKFPSDGIPVVTLGTVVGELCVTRRNFAGGKKSFAAATWEKKNCEQSAEDRQ